jgi:hypothetical protein
MSPIAFVTPRADELTAYRCSTNSMEEIGHHINDNRCDMLSTEMISNAPCLPNLDIDSSSCIQEDYRILMKVLLPQTEHGETTCRFNYLTQDECKKKTTGSPRCDELVVDGFYNKEDSKPRAKIPYFPTDIEMDDTILKKPRRFLQPRSQSKRYFSLSV